METFLLYYINKATRDKNKSKIKTLGPYARCLDIILKEASKKRKNIKI